MNIKELRDKWLKALVDAKAICDKAESEKRDFSAEERTQVAALLEEAKKLKDQIKQLEGDEALRKAVLELGGGLDVGQNAGQRQDGAPAGRGKSLGEQFVEAEQFKAWLKGISPSGQIPDSLKGIHSPPVSFRDLGVFGRKDLVTGADDTSAGAFVTTDNTGIYEPLGRRPRTLLDLVAKRTTTSDLVEFVRQTAIVQQATPVAEANVTTYSGGTGEVSGQKPEGSMAFERVQAAVKTIAVWVPATKRALSDASQIRGIIDQELRDDIVEELEDQIYDGDGTGENLTGILHTTGVLVQPWDTDALTTARKAKTYVMTTGRSRPTAWVMNPADWEMFELLQDLAGRYYWGGPLANGDPRLWGIPVVESECVHEGQAILGNWSKAVLWNREQASIQVSDSHSDFFIRNMVAILCELRAAFGLIRPSAFCLVDLSSGS